MRHQTFAILESSLSLTEDYSIPDEEGFFIDELGTLTIPSGVTMTVAANSLLINQGVLNVDGTLVIDAGGVFENNSVGVSNNAANTIDVFGTLTNRGTINNDGTITLHPGGTANDRPSCLYA